MPNITENSVAISTPEKRKPGRISNREFQAALELHKQWIESHGEQGQQADFSRCDLETLDLTDTQLSAAILNQANLRGVDLLLADLEDASLLQADLRDANLLGAKLRQAGLQGANFTGAKALLGEQLAGSNLFAATLPDSVSIPEAVKHVCALARQTAWLLGTTLLFDGLTCLRTVTVNDARLIRNAPVLPIAGSATVLPLVPFFLFCPVLILGLFLFLHFHLQRLWEAAAGLPAILPDGSRLDSYLPWFAKWPPRRHFRWLKQRSSALSVLASAIAKFVLYAPAPIAILFFWCRYLTVQDLRGTTLQVFLALAAAAAALHFHAAARRPFLGDSLPLSRDAFAPAAKLRWLSRGILALFALTLYLLSVGSILGAPHSSSPRTSTASQGVRTWAADLLWTAGFSPYANLTESAVSTAPRFWSGKDSDLALVQGANLNAANLRYAEAYRAFLPKARLWKADLRFARLSEADLRAANLRQANLRAALLDRTRLDQAVLLEADLRDANLTQASLRNANLSYAFLGGANLRDAQLDSADLYASQLQNALLERDSLRSADLRDANLEGADLALSNLQDAYLSSAKMAGARLRQSQLAQAILTEADLRRADLTGANLQGALLQGVNFEGADLQGAQLRGAFGLDAAQLCAAANLHQTQLDDLLERDVEARCPAMH